MTTTTTIAGLAQTATTITSNDFFILDQFVGPGYTTKKVSPSTITNFVGSILTPLTTKGDLLTYSTLNARLPVGSDGQFLTSNSAQATGLLWTGSFVNNAVGYSLAGGTTARTLTVSANSTIDQNLSMSSSVTFLNVSAGSNGVPGTLNAYSPTSGKGKLTIASADNSGAFTVGIINASMGQSTTFTLPDPGLASSAFVLTHTTGGAGIQTIQNDTHNVLQLAASTSSTQLWLYTIGALSNGLQVEFDNINQWALIDSEIGAGAGWPLFINYSGASVGIGSTNDSVPPYPITLYDVTGAQKQIIFNQISTPSTPVGGTDLYSKSDGYMYVLPPSGIEQRISGPGAGAITASNGVKFVSNDLQFDPTYSPSFVNLTLTGTVITGSTDLTISSISQTILSTAQIVFNASSAVTVNSQLFVNDSPLYISSSGAKLFKLQFDDANLGMVQDSLDGVGGSSPLWINPTGGFSGFGFLPTVTLQSILSVSADIFLNNITTPSTPTGGGKLYCKNNAGLSDLYFLDTAGTEHLVIGGSVTGYWSRTGTTLTPATSGDAVTITGLLTSNTTNYPTILSVPVPSSGANVFYFQDQLYAVQPTGVAYNLTNTQVGFNLSIGTLAPLSSMQSTIPISGFPSQVNTAIPSVKESTSGVPIAIKVISTTANTVVVEVYNLSAITTTGQISVYVTCTGV